MTPLRFRKKPVVIEAMRFEDAESASAIQAWAPPGTITYYPNGLIFTIPPHDRRGPAQLGVQTPTGKSTANLGDWIGHQVVNGLDDFWPIAADIFEATYDAVDALVP